MKKIMLPLGLVLATYFLTNWQKYLPHKKYLYTVGGKEFTAYDTDTTYEVGQYICHYIGESDSISGIVKSKEYKGGIFIK
jgi:hypothetical protein